MTDFKNEMDIGMSSINLKLEKYGMSVYKLAVMLAGVIFCVFSMIYTLYHDNMDNVLYILATVMLVFVPFIVGVLMKFSINSAVFTFIIFYAVAPLLGSMYKLYYLTDWWDDLLHFSGGVVFAIFGIFVAKFLNRKGKNTLVMCAVFAFCFSLGIAVLWEFFEYAMDVFFGMDMQVDTFIDHMNSYLLGSEPGVKGEINGIKDVYVNGQRLEGYIDIGLIDTMKDMMLECSGAFIYCVIFLIDRDRHPLFRFTNEKKQALELDLSE